MLVVLSLNPTNSSDIELEKKSVIKFGWGMMFDYYGQMLHGLNKYNLIVGVRVPRMEELKLDIPYLLQSSVCNRLKDDDSLSIFKPVCQSAVQTQFDMRQRLKEVRGEIQSLIAERIPYILRRFSPEPVSTQTVQRPTTHAYFRQNDKFNYLSASYQTKRLRKRRFISELIGLGIQGISTYLEYRKTSRFEKGIQQLMRHNSLQDKEIKAIKKDMMSLTKATVKDLTELRYDISHHAEMINRLTRETDRLVTTLQHHGEWIADVKRAMLFFNSYFNQVYLQLNKYLDLFKDLKSKLQHYVKAIELVGMNRLSADLITNEKLTEMLDHVKGQLSEHYPNFEIVTDNEQDYYQMPLISATYVQNMIVLQIPIYIKPITQKPLVDV